MTVLTLTDYAASDKPLLSGVADVLRKASPIMDMIPFVTTGSLSVEAMRQAGLPTVSWRKAGEAHGSSKGRVDMVREQAFSFGNSIDVDKVYVKQSNSLYDARALWTKQTMSAMAYEFNNKFINGSPITDMDELPGLFWRTQNDLPAAQSVNGGGVDISADNGSLSSAMQTFLDALNALLYEMPEGKADALIMNKTTYLRMQSLFRQANVLSTSRDKLDREIYTYNGATLLDAGYLADQSTKIITDTELANGTALTGATFTSIYAVRFGQEYMTGFQEYPLEVTDLGLINDGVTYRTVVDWVVGMAITHPRSVARLYNIQAA